MTQDLRIVNYTLKASDSDVSSNFVIPVSSSSWSLGATIANVYYRDQNYGTYYSFHAATAGDGSRTSGESPYSVCPKGWKLPSNSDASALISAQGDIISSPSNFHLFKHGYYTGRGTSESVSWYWTSTVTSSHGGNIDCSSTCSVVNSNSTTGQKQYGNPVRCLTR